MVATCFHHRDRDTGRACTRCGRPACPDCLHEAPVGAHCWECIKAARPPTRERVRRWNATAGPVVSLALIALNVGVFALTTISHDLESRLALFGPAVAAGEWYRLVTAGFVHYGILHIAFNMLLLYRFGEMLERDLGRVRFLALYVAALLTGSLGALILEPTALTAGASGAVFGLAGAAAVGLHRRGVGIWQTEVGGLLAVNLLLTFLVPDISIGGHLGGLAGGALVGAVMARTGASPRRTLVGLLVALAVAVVAVAGAGWAAAR